ncbi:hypothetical protein ACFLW2_03480 [Chloroflexota bacterium]
MLDSDGQKYISENGWGGNAVLNAGESITLETFWDQKWLSEIDASFGYYMIGATFNDSIGSEEGLRFRDWDLSVSSSVEVTIWAGSYENGVDRGDWLHDEEEGVWYQEVQLTAAPKSAADASRSKAKYRETLFEIPGLNGIGTTRYPFPDGNSVIRVTFRSQQELDDAMRQYLIPPLLDGVPVIVQDTSANYAPLAANLNNP